MRGPKKRLIRCGPNKSLMVRKQRPIRDGYFVDRPHKNDVPPFHPNSVFELWILHRQPKQSYGEINGSFKIKPLLSSPSTIKSRVARHLRSSIFKKKIRTELLVVGERKGKMETASSSSAIFTNYPLVSALVAVAIGQFAKLFTYWYREKRLDLWKLVGSGGMPSSHAATVAALAAAIGLQDGLGGPQFAIALVFACIVLYDATGVRLHAGRQAEVLNQIVYELPAAHPLAESRPLRELLGHTPLQVIAGCLLGIVSASFGYVVVSAVKLTTIS